MNDGSETPRERRLRTSWQRIPTPDEHGVQILWSGSLPLKIALLFAAFGAYIGVTIAGSLRLTSFLTVMSGTLSCVLGLFASYVVIRGVSIASAAISDWVNMRKPGDRN